MTHNEHPLFEFDSEEGVIHPSIRHKPQNISPSLVLCFFPEVFEKLLSEGSLTEVHVFHTEMGDFPVYHGKHNGNDFAVVHPGIGAPLAAIIVEAAIAIGARKIVACGGAGVLKKEIVVGHPIVPTVAIRDEGTSFHYVAASREIELDADCVRVVKQVLDRNKVDYITGKTWTTDAFFRETPNKVARRRDEGCLCVEMECSALTAVARFRNVKYAQILYGGDDVSSKEWDIRGWTRQSIREKLLYLAAEAVLEL